MNVLKYGKLEINPSKMSETMNVQMKKSTQTKIVTESFEDGEFLLPRIEAIHAGRTRNYNHYLAEKLRGDASIKSGVYSWMQPYAKPVIYNHDTNTEATGRIYSAAYAEYTQAGRPGIIVIPKITEAKAVQALKDGRLLTVSIGATTDAAICSICGTDIINEGYCGHMKGEEYDGRTAEWIAGNIWFDELSWVNVPADADAMVVDTQSSVLLSLPREGAGENTESAPKIQTMHEFYGVPKHTNLVVVESKELKTKEAEISKQEEKEEMENELQPETTVETPVVEPEVTVEEPAVEPAAPIDAPVVDSDPSSEGDTPETETVVTQEEDSEPETAFLTAESIGEHPETIALRETNASLMAQVEGLTKEIKALYIERIIEKSELSKEKQAPLAEKLASRSIDSLRDRLEDMAEGFGTVEPEAKPARTVTKVASPVPTTEAAVTTKEMTNETKIEFFKQLLKK